MDLEQITLNVNRFINGDTKAFEELYHLTSKRVYFVCLNLLGNEHDVNDAMQDVYLTACKNIRQLKEPSSFPAWVERIAVNRCKDIIKKKTPTPVDDTFFKETLLAEDELMLPEEYILNADRRKTLLKIMREQLSELQFQTIILYYFSNMSVAEIAEIMDCSEGAVKNRLAVSRAKIKKYVEEQEKSSGSQMFVFAGVPFLTKLFDEESKLLTAPAFKTSMLANASSGAASIIKTGGFVMSKKVLIGAIVGVAAVGGIAAAVLLPNKSDEPVSDTEVSVTESIVETVVETDSDQESTIKDLSPEEVFANAQGTLLKPTENSLDFYYEDGDDRIEVNMQGHIKRLWSYSCNGSVKFLTDDNKFGYVNGDSLDILEKEAERFEENSFRDHGSSTCVLIKNTDGTHSLIWPTGNTVFLPRSENIVAAYAEFLDAGVYTLRDGTLYYSVFDADGSVIREEKEVEFRLKDSYGADGVSKIVREMHTRDDHFYILDDNNTLYEMRENGDSPFIVRFAENIDRYFGECIEDVDSFYCTKPSDSDNIYYFDVDLRDDWEKVDEQDRYTVTESAIPLPDGCKTDDIQIVKAYRGVDPLFMVANDKFYLCKDPVNEKNWEEIEELSVLYKEKYIVDLAFTEYDDQNARIYSDRLGVLCNDGKLYYTDFE